MTLKIAAFSCRSQLEVLFLIALPLKMMRMMMMAKRKKKVMKRANLRMILNLKASVMKMRVHQMHLKNQMQLILAKERKKSQVRKMKRNPPNPSKKKNLKRQNQRKLRKQQKHQLQRKKTLKAKQIPPRQRRIRKTSSC